MELIYKYPRTHHIEGSRFQTGDENLDCVPFDTIKDYYLVLEEKVDGANCGISFNKNGQLLLQSRGHYLNGGYGEKQFDLFKVWANCYQTQLYELLKDRYIIYGEWLYAKHTVFYDKLTHYFMEFDIYDKANQKFLSTKKRRKLLKPYYFIASVLVLFEGKIDTLSQLSSYLGKSYFKSDTFLECLKLQCQNLKLSYEIAKKQTDQTNLMEGIYIKVEGSPKKNTFLVSEDYVLGRYKYVRNTFLNTILDSETHWVSRPIIPNQLKEDIDIFTFKRED